MSDLSLPIALAPAAAPGTPLRLADTKARSLFRRATIQTRLTIAFWAVGGLSLVTTVAAIWQLRALERQAVQGVQAVRVAGELYGAVSAAAARAPAQPRADGAAASATEQKLDQLHRALAQASPSDQGRQLAREVDAARKAWQATLRSGADPAALLAAGEAYADAARTALEFHGDTGEGAAELQGWSGRASRELLLLFLVLTVLTIPLVVMLLVHILRPMYGAVRIARRVADGDLTVKVRTGGGDEMARLMLALDDMTANLRRMVGEVVGSAGAVAQAGEQVRLGQADLSERTEMQASTLEETASSMEGLTATVTQNADNAKQASQLAVSASDVARKGGQVVGQVVSTMTGISESSKKISDIISVIDGIAFQTNILALNAAVEAARAGEQGRGFAVVAAEVRNLAQRSAAAAKEIKGLIGDSVDKVETGTRLVDAAGKTMGEIVQSVKRVSDLVAEIAAASEEQRSGIEQVNAAIGQMDQVVQKNAALVEHTSQATEALRRHSDALVQSVSQFRLEDGQQ